MEKMQQLIWEMDPVCSVTVTQQRRPDLPVRILVVLKRFPDPDRKSNEHERVPCLKGPRQLVALQSRVR